MRDDTSSPASAASISEYARHFLDGRPDAEAIHYKLGGPALIRDKRLVAGLITDTQARYAAASGPRPKKAPGALPRYLAQDVASYARYVPMPFTADLRRLARDAVYLNVAQHALAYRSFSRGWRCAGTSVASSWCTT